MVAVLGSPSKVADVEHLRQVYVGPLNVMLPSKFVIDRASLV